MRARQWTAGILLVGVLAITICGLTVVGAVAPAGACTCIAGESDESYFEKADVVFVGTLAEVSPTTGGGVIALGGLTRLLFHVDEVFKGDVATQQSVVTARDGTACGLGITGPGQFLVFAWTEATLTTGAMPGDVSSSSCSGTRAMADAEDFPASFRDSPPLSDGSSDASVESADPAPDRSADDTAERTSSYRWIPVALIAGLLIAIVMATRKPRRRPIE